MIVKFSSFEALQDISRDDAPCPRAASPRCLGWWRSTRRCWWLPWPACSASRRWWWWPPSASAADSARTRVTGPRCSEPRTEQTLCICHQRMKIYLCFKCDFLATNLCTYASHKTHQGVDSVDVKNKTVRSCV